MSKFIDEVLGIVFVIVIAFMVGWAVFIGVAYWISLQLGLVDVGFWVLTIGGGSIAWMVGLSTVVSIINNRTYRSR